MRPVWEMLLTNLLTILDSKFDGPSPQTLFTDKDFAAQQLDLYEKKREGEAVMTNSKRLY